MDSRADLVISGPIGEVLGMQSESEYGNWGYKNKGPGKQGTAGVYDGMEKAEKHT